MNSLILICTVHKVNQRCLNHCQEFINQYVYKVRLLNSKYFNQVFLEIWSFAKTLLLDWYMVDCENDSGKYWNSHLDIISIIKPERAWLPYFVQWETLRIQDQTVCAVLSDLVINYHITIQHIPKRQILNTSKLKEFAGDNLRFEENGRKYSQWLENTVGKGEIACYEQFLLFPQCFYKTCTADTLKPGLVWESLNYM